MKNKMTSREKIKAPIKSFQALWGSGVSRVRSHPFYQSVQVKVGKRNLNWLMTACGLIFLLLILRACHSSGRDKHPLKPPVPVVIAKVRKQNVPLYLKTIGTVIPIDSVIVKTQINGRLIKVLFQEGQLVKKGELLAQIDPRPYDAQLKQYEGQLQKDQAFLENARLDLKRYKKLYKEDSVSSQTLDTQGYLVKQYEGIVKSDQGLVDSARANLLYCKIISDITGIIGLREVNPGNFVQTTDTTPITTINTISPISVVFPLAEDDLIQVQDKFKNNASLVVDAFDRKEESLLDTGYLSAIDSQIDPSTGTVKLKAIFKNERSRLFPNQFVNIRLTLDTLRDTLVIPTAAIQIGRQSASFVYSLNDHDQSVSVKPVTVKTSVGEDSAITAEKLAEGQSIVIQGQDKLTEGAVVAVSKGHPVP